MYLRCSTSRAKYYASVLLCDHPDDAPPRGRARARARVACEGRRDCGFERGVCLHVGTRQRICYTLVTRSALLRRGPEIGREGGRKRKRVRWYSEGTAGEDNAPLLVILAALGWDFAFGDSVTEIIMGIRELWCNNWVIFDVKCRE